MPDIGWMELLVIGVVALIVVGPNDFPKMFRKLGQITGRIRGMAKEFTRAMDEAAGDTGMKDLNKDLRNIANPKKMGLDAVNKAFEDIDPTKYDEGSATRGLAEKRAAARSAVQAKARTLSRAEEDEIRNAKLASAVARAEEAAEASAEDVAESSAEEAAAAEEPPAQTGTGKP